MRCFLILAGTAALIYYMRSKNKADAAKNSTTTDLSGTEEQRVTSAPIVVQMPSLQSLNGFDVISWVDNKA